MAKKNKFGTFGGVFVPSILTILGVIMYLRLPTIVGEAGLWATIGIIIVAHIISATTGLSVSSIATDKKVEAGGTYYMISRSLGLPIGGTLGIALFIGLSFSVSLYLIGFSESFLNYWQLPTDINNIRLTGTIVLLAVTTLTFISTSLAIKTQYFIMAAIGLSLVSILFGSHDFAPDTPVFTNPSSTVPLMVLFGIFFPAVTGFEAGVSMSGDLQDPKKSIPLGSITAIVVGLVVYIGMAIFLTLTVSGDALANDPNILLKMALVPEVVIAGIWGATLSSSLGSILGAPRILQATAVDKITPKVFAKGYGATNEPRNALLLTFVIAEAGILIGELDLIARIVSIFFITTYGFLNVSATFERWTSTDFRPEFKVPGWISVVGAIACILVMIQLDLAAMVGAIVILSVLFLYLKRKELTLDSGDAWSGVWASLVKTGLTNLKRDKLHKRNWRPNIIMFSGNADTRRYMQEIGKAISGKFGILSAFELVKTDDKLLDKTESILSQEKESGYFRHKMYCRDVYEGMEQISRVFGFSGVEPNSILMGWSQNESNRANFTQLLKSFGHNRYNTLFLKYDLDKKYGENSTIDIWWNGKGRNLAFAINLIRPIAYSKLWRNAKVRLLMINPVNEEAENLYKSTAAILANYRTDAEIRIVNNEIDPQPDRSIIVEESKDTDLVILGIADKKYYQLDKYYDEINSTVCALGSTLLIHAADDFEELEVLTETKSKSAQLVEDIDKEVIQLPPLKYSKYPEISTDIIKIDINGQKVLELLHRKAFLPIFKDHNTILSDLSDRVKYIQKELKKIGDFEDSYRRKKAIDKLKNEIFYRINALFTERLLEKNLPDQLTKLNEGIAWYHNRLIDEFKRFPKRLIINYQDSDFTIQPNDSLGLKNFKRWKNTKHWLVGKPITHKIRYKEVARYYQLHNRLQFLSQLLYRFEEEEMAFYHDLRKITNAIVIFLDETERKIWDDSKEWNDQAKLNKVLAMIDKESQSQIKLSTLYESRLQLEFRKNLQRMNNDLEQLDINNAIEKKKKPAKYISKLTADILQAPEEILGKIKTLLNMILMELSVNATKNRIEDLHEKFGEQLRHTIRQKYLRELDSIIQHIEKQHDPAILDKYKLEEEFENDLYQLFSETLEKMLALTESMPESVEVYSSTSGHTEEDEDTLAISVASMAEYYLKSRYEVAVEQEFENVMDAVKRSIYASRDLLNLTQFNIENTDKTATSEVQHSLLDDCAGKLAKEKEAILEKLEQYNAYANTQFERAFEPLSSFKIEESARDFASGLRNYQGQKVLSGMSYITGEINKFLRSSITRLFYSRSEGILLAKKLSSNPELKSINSRLLDLHDKVNPSPEVIKSLPQYYVTLFNGKSSISKDFWIPRPTDERTFNKAMQRYQQGYGGGILLLGDRNSGKTAFSKYVTHRYLKKKQTYALFPPLQGSPTLQAFAEALRKATQKYGDTTQILSQLPEGSTVVINDLELFWERHEDGLDVVRHLSQLIDDYGQKILFIVNMNPHAYKVINGITSLGDKFIEIINFHPFDAEELKDLIMKRHRSSGLSVRFAADEDQLGDLQLAQLFNSYFNLGEGNPGTALNSWLANIKKATGNQLIIQKPESPSLAVFKELSEEWVMVITQIVLHKRITIDKLSRITEWDYHQSKTMIQAMLRAGLIIEKASGTYHIDPFIQPFVVKALKEREVLS